MTTTDDDRRLGRGQPADGRTRPASFGLDAPARNRVRKLRRQRNLALHGGFDQAGAQQPTQCLDRDDSEVCTEKSNRDNTQAKLQQQHGRKFLAARASKELTRMGEDCRPSA